MLEKSDFIQRTYSVKSYRKRKTLPFKKILMYFSIILGLFFVLGVIFLSANELI